VAVCPHDALLYLDDRKTARELKRAKATGVAYGIYEGRAEHSRKRAEEAVEYLMELVEKSGELDV